MGVSGANGASATAPPGAVQVATARPFATAVARRIPPPGWTRRACAGVDREPPVPPAEQVGVEPGQQPGRQPPGRGVAAGEVHEPVGRVLGGAAGPERQPRGAQVLRLDGEQVPDGGMRTERGWPGEELRGAALTAERRAHPATTTR